MEVSIDRPATPRSAAVDPARDPDDDDPLKLRFERHLAPLPLPGSGRTLQRWQALAEVAALDLGLAKLYESHNDAVAILAELGDAPLPSGVLSGVWAAEPPDARVIFEADGRGGVRLSGTKAWCSGAAVIDRALLTVWHADGRGPWLADVALDEPGIECESMWKAPGMAKAATVDVRFSDVPARLVGRCDDYLARPGFWHGGIGIAACWHGGACALADALRTQARTVDDPGWHRLLALGEVDTLLRANAALLREAAAWVDRHPRADARAWALRTRAASDATAQRVLAAVARALGAGPLCRDDRLAQLFADLPVFIRQSHGDRDLAALGEMSRTGDEAAWHL